MRRITWLIALVLAAGVLTAAGCGGDDDESGAGGSGGGTGTEESSGGAGGGGGGETLTVTADPGGEISWEPTELNAKAGSVTIELVNESDVPHAIEVEGNGVEEESETVTAKNTELTVDLEAGEYEFYCPVGDHAETMKGTLTVE
jgi:plastocyanin